MRIGILISIIGLIFIYLWSLHGMDICAYSDNINCFDRSIFLNIISVFVIITVLLIQISELHKDLYNKS